MVQRVEKRTMTKKEVKFAEGGIAYVSDDFPELVDSQTYVIDGTYGSNQTPTEVYVMELEGGGKWYAARDSVNVNYTNDSFYDGVDIETISDIDTITASKPIEYSDDLEDLIVRHYGEMLEEREDSIYAKGGGVSFDEIMKSDKSDWNKIKRKKVDWDNFDKLSKKDQQIIMKDFNKDFPKGDTPFLAKGGRVIGDNIDNAFLNASKKSELYLDVNYTNGKTKTIPIKTKTLKGIEQQAEDLFDLDNVNNIQLVRFWGDSKKVDSVVDLMEKGGTLKRRFKGYDKMYAYAVDNNWTPNQLAEELKFMTNLQNRGDKKLYDFLNKLSYMFSDKPIAEFAKGGKKR